ncbi:MAG: DUF5017 domain-containing protein [Alistipes sp.]|nr:DUF5017 domain-containing protein [Alistipes sp.]
MKRNIYLWMAAAAMLTACDKGFEKVSEPTLELSTPMTTYYTQEPVVFNIESDANFLAFYSGERGNDYAYAKKERIYEGDVFLSFNTAFQAGAQWKNQLEADVEKKPLRFFYSTDFSGVYTLEEIDKATWHELTDQFTFPSARATNAKVLTQTTESGVRNFAELVPEEEWAKPIYFAFRYKIDPYDGSNARSRASVMNFNLYTRCEEVNATETLASQAKAGWQLVKKGYEADTAYAPEVTSTMVWFDCDGGEPANANERICWAVSAPIAIKHEVNIGCDYGVGIKSFAEEAVTSYTYTYATPGVYDVYVTAANVDHEGSRMEKTASVRIEVVEQGHVDIEQPGEGEW